MCYPGGWQLEQNDTRTLLHYAVMLRDKVHDSKKDPERAEQLLQQAMGELKSTDNGLRNHLAVLGRRHRSNEQLFLSPKPKPRD